MSKKLTKDIFIAKARKLNGNRYEYTDILYVNNSTHVDITCRVHGKFKQSPSNHLSGKQCKFCAQTKRERKQKHPRDKVEKDFREVHGDKYDYCKFMYKNTDTPSIIICKQHGDFKQSYSNHKNGYGCAFCDGNIVTEKIILERFLEKHGKRYDYSKFKYNKAKTKETIICKIHGEFKQSSDTHQKGIGCIKCSVIKVGRGKKIINSTAISNLIKTHGDKYDYSKFIYTGVSEDGIVICKVHGEFIIKYNAHQQGGGCQKCSTSGFSMSKQAILYYVKVKNIAYKIGVTNRTIKDRFRKDFKNIEIIKTWEYQAGRDAYKEEQEILNSFKYAKYKGVDILESGNTELFDRDILLLDTLQQRA